MGTTVQYDTITLIVLNSSCTIVMECPPRFQMGSISSSIILIFDSIILLYNSSICQGVRPPEDATNSNIDSNSGRVEVHTINTVFDRSGYVRPSVASMTSVVISTFWYMLLWRR